MQESLLIVVADRAMEFILQFNPTSLTQSGGETEGVGLARRKSVDRCQMPCSQWDARRPGSEDVRVIGPLLRFRLLRPRGTRFGGLTEPVLSLQWKRPSWCRRGATDYRLACRRPSSHPSPYRFSLPSSFSRSSDSPSPCTRYTCCLPRIIRPSSCTTPPGPSSPSMTVHRASQKLLIDYPVLRFDKLLLGIDSGRK